MLGIAAGGEEKADALEARPHPEALERGEVRLSGAGGSPALPAPGTGGGGLHSRPGAPLRRAFDGTIEGEKGGAPNILRSSASAPLSSLRPTMRSTIPCAMRNSDVWNPSGSSCWIVCLMTRGPAKSSLC